MSSFHLSKSEVLPSPYEIHNEIRALPQHSEFIRQSRAAIEKILDGTDSRFIIVAGPCSIHDLAAAKEYAQKLIVLSKEVSDLCLLIMRVHAEKPRTSLGWKGLLYDPLLNDTHDIKTGIRWNRQLLLDLAELGIPTAAEFLDPATALYYSDLISWGCIGARTSASQIHRQLASGLPMPIAFKNSTDGNIDNAVNGVLSARTGHSFAGIDMMGQISVLQTKGNPHGHIVLRGGEQQPNYDPQSIAGALNKLESAKLPLRLLVDCSHDNSFRKYEQQCAVFQSVLHQVIDGNSYIRGVILESNLFAGNQHIASDPAMLQYAVSVTDPCLDWPSTEKLIQWGYAKLKQENATKVLCKSRA